MSSKLGFSELLMKVDDSPGERFHQRSTQQDVLAMSATTLPASATGSHTSTQSQSGGQQQTQVSPKTGSQVQQQKWSLNDKGVEGSRLTPSEQAKFQQFKAGIEQGLAPIQAAKKVGSTDVPQTQTRQPIGSSDREGCVAEEFDYAMSEVELHQLCSQTLVSC